MRTNDDSKYMTVSDVAKRLHISVKSARDYFVHGRRVECLQLAAKYLIDRASFEAWERDNRTTVIKRR